MVHDLEHGLVEIRRSYVELREHAERFRELADNARDIIYRYRLAPPQGFDYVSPSVTEITGYTPEEHYADPELGFKIVHPDDRHLLETRTLVENQTLVLRWVTKDGRVLWTEQNNRIVFDEARTPVAIEGIARDVTRRKKHETELRLHAEVLSHLAQGVCMINARDAVISYANARLEQIFGYAPGELVGKHLSTLAAGGADDACREMLIELERGGAWRGEIRTVKRDGTTFWAHANVSQFDHSDLGTVWVAEYEDATERRQVRQKLLLSDSMASLGALAGVVGQEIGNPMAVILANLAFASDELRRLKRRSGEHRISELLESLQETRKGAERIRHLLREMSFFSSENGRGSDPVDLNSVVQLAVNMASPTIRSRARLVEDYAELRPVLGSESRLAQVMLNILVNAAQAIPEGNPSGHEIRVSTRSIGAGRVAVRVEDTGCGIPEVIRERIFEPFFTTKEGGPGFGLGLSVAHAIVTSLGGVIELETEAGRGSAFRVVLPTAPEAKLADESTQAVEAAVTRGRVLVVAEERLIAAMLRRLLAKEHEVEIEHAAQRALERIKQGEVYDAIVCDLIMPRMTGIDLFREVSRTRPQQADAMVFLTDGLHTPLVRDFLDEVPNLHVEKPFEFRTLSALVGAIVRRTG